MRNEIDLLNSFEPIHEKEYEARLFIDKAIKNSTEFHLEAIARALSGNYELKTSKANGKPFEKTEHINSDDGDWVKKTEKFEWEIRFGSYVLFGKNKIDLWLKVIEFWGAKESIFPCGGAYFPNNKVETKTLPDS